MNTKQDPEHGAKRRSLILTVDNEAGVLARIAGLISGCGWNIDSLTVHVCENPRLALITLVFMATDMLAEHVVQKIGGLIPVHEVQDLSDNPSRVEVQLVLIKIIVGPKFDPSVVEALIEEHKATVHTKTGNILIVSKAGSEPSCTGLIAILKEFGTIVTNGSGVVVLA